VLLELRVLPRVQLGEEEPGPCGFEPAWIPFPITNYMSGIKPWLKKYSFLWILESVNIGVTEHSPLINSHLGNDDFWWEKLCSVGFFLIFFTSLDFFINFIILLFP